MEMQGAMTIFAVNLKRIIKLMSKKQSDLTYNSAKQNFKNPPEPDLRLVDFLFVENKIYKAYVFQCPRVRGRGAE